MGWGGVGVRVSIDKCIMPTRLGGFSGFLSMQPIGLHNPTKEKKGKEEGKTRKKFRYQ